MSRIRGRDTLPEMIVRRVLHAKGWRFRVCDKRFAGRPDVVIPRAKTIIDIRGCFWHRHGCKDSTMPKSNVAFWMEKWSKNVRRDVRNEETKRLLDYGFANYALYSCAKIELSPIKTVGGKQDVCRAGHDGFTTVVKRGEAAKIQVEYEIPEVLRAPVAVGETVGRAIFRTKDGVVGEVPVRAIEAVGRVTFLDLFFRMLRALVLG